MPSAYAQRLAAAWPETSARLHAQLRSRGVGPHEAEDVVQETVTRALERTVPFEDATDLLRWASVVARNLCIDRARARAHLTSDSTLVDLASDHDVAEHALTRCQLAVVLTAMTQLAPAEQESILAGIHNGTSQPSALRVRRHRARTKLRGLTAGLLTLWGLVVTAVRRQGWVVVPLASVSVALLTLPLPRVLEPPVPDISTTPAPRTERAQPAGAEATERLVPPPEPRRPKLVRPPGGAPPVPSRMEARGPGGAGVVYERRQATDEDPLVCLNDLPVLGTICDPLQPLPR